MASGGPAKFFLLILCKAAGDSAIYRLVLCGSLLVLAICDFRCAVDVSAPVFRIFHLDYELR